MDPHYSPNPSIHTRQLTLMKCGRSVRRFAGVMVAHALVDTSQCHQRKDISDDQQDVESSAYDPQAVRQCADCGDGDPGPRASQPSQHHLHRRHREGRLKKVNADMPVAA